MKLLAAVLITVAAPFTWEQIQTEKCRTQCSIPTKERESYDDGGFDPSRGSCYCVDFEAQRVKKAKLPARLKGFIRNVDPEPQSNWGDSSSF